VDGAAYLFIDVDDFKSLNDGPRSHQVGDQVLVALGSRLRRCVRVTDAVGRRGGDEFMVLFNGVRDEAAALRLAGRIQEAIREPIATDDGPKTIDASIGVAMAVPGRRDFEPDLRGRADAAMYEAKAAGGGIRAWRESTDP
jgi:diguanylate cyclase (GGDEF)-like protein